MKVLALVIFCLVSSQITAQWQSISKNGNYEIEPYRQFSINPLIDLTKLQSGIYFLAIDGNVKRFVKE